MARIVFIGLTITSSWGNGHATTYRALIKALARRGHQVIFLERDVPWYRDNRDFLRSPYCRILLYRGLADLKTFAPLVRDAGAVIVGSYVPDGIEAGLWATSTAEGTTAFYDIDTPVTLKAVESGRCEYLNTRLIGQYDIYLSFTGGPALERLRALGSPCPAPLYCSVDPEFHAPVGVRRRWRLGYLGTYAADRQPALERTLFEPALALPNENFAVAGPQYPDDTQWPENVEYIPHLPPERHAAFYCGQNFALNLTRADMRALGYSPSVRLFEAASCGVPIISDEWAGLETLFAPGKEILIAENAEDVLHHLRTISPAKAREIGQAARARVLAAHTSQHRAEELEGIFRMASPKVAGAA